MSLTLDGCRRVVPVAALLLVITAGCHKSSPLSRVQGRVTLEGGAPLTRGLVIFEGVIDGTPVSARGPVNPDGSFLLSTHKPGDGVPTGKYRVLINPLVLSEVPDEQKELPFDHKYLRFETSGLEYEVKSGPNDFPITLAVRHADKDVPQDDSKDSP